MMLDLVICSPPERDTAFFIPVVPRFKCKTMSRDYDFKIRNLGIDWFDFFPIFVDIFSGGIGFKLLAYLLAYYVNFRS
jgi:hypothetical protein